MTTPDPPPPPPPSAGPDAAAVPCPFCGDRNLIHEWNGAGAFVVCGDCDCFGPEAPIEHVGANRQADWRRVAYAAWNRRASPPAGVDAAAIGRAAEAVVRATLGKGYHPQFHREEVTRAARILADELGRCGTRTVEMVTLESEAEAADMTAAKVDEWAKTLADDLSKFDD